VNTSQTFAVAVTVIITFTKSPQISAQFFFKFCARLLLILCAIFANSADLVYRQNGREFAYPLVVLNNQSQLLIVS